MQAEVSAWADRYGVAAHRAFPAWALNLLFDMEDDDAFIQSDTLQQGDAGVDGWLYDREAGVFHLVQAKYLSEPLEATASVGALRELLSGAALLKDPSGITDGPHAEKLAEVAHELGEARLDDAAISLDFIVAGRVSTAAMTELAQSAAQIDESFGVQLYDTEQLYEARLAIEPIEDLTGESICFSLASPGEYFTRTMTHTGVEQAAVAALDGRSLADAASDWKARLFHANIRYYLRKQNRINRGMSDTLSDEEERPAFWLYNNGLTIVADSFELVVRDDGTEVITVANPQIVNGAQTASVLREQRNHISSGDVAVQARLISLTDDDAGRAELENISKYTNSQSPVRDSDLRSNDRRHRQLQSSFDMLVPPVFYERRRGEWQSLTAAQRARYSKRVGKEDVGQRFLAYRLKPSHAVSNKAALYGELESEAFDPELSGHVYMLAYGLFEAADHLLQANHEAELLELVPSLAGRKPGADETSPERLETLRTARKLVAMHVVALSRQILDWRYTDLDGDRARQLRALVIAPGGVVRDFLMKHAFREIRRWVDVLADGVTLKTELQRPASLEAIQANLSDALADANRDELPELA